MAALLAAMPAAAAAQVVAEALAAGHGSERTGSAPALAEPSVFHLFLLDGTAIATLGEFARVGDRVVFTLPISATREILGSLPAAHVNWERTNRHTESVRAAQYASSRGDADFAAMSGMVARTLSDITITPGAAAQLELAERARRTLAEWPRRHYNYRADEVRQTLSLLDEVVAGLRAAAGRTSFDVSFVANTLPPPVEPVLPRPTLQESIDHALRLSDLAASAAERTMLLRAVGESLREHAGALPAAWVSVTRARAMKALEVERRVDRSYAALTARAMKAIDRPARVGDVRALVRLRSRVVQRDRALGSKRPGELESLLAAIDQQLDAARRMTLARDRFAARLPAVRQFREAVTPFVTVLERGRPALADIKALAGPAAERLSTFVTLLGRHRSALRLLPVPDEAKAAHASLTSALQLAETAARYRQRAIAGNDMRLAWDASAAAAGALLLLERARADIAGLLERPQ